MPRVLVIWSENRQALQMALTEREKAIIDFERGWWTEDGVKDQMLRERFQCSSDEYYGDLNRLLDSPEALAYDPLVVRRLQRARERRRRMRLDGNTESGGVQA
ncbi:MAG: hypothetical protein RL547_1933 [Actinomycetota bacterium]|jgi:hypothetical protein